MIWCGFLIWRQSEEERLTAKSLLEYVRAHWIHPGASWRDHEERGATILRSGKGAYLTDIEGRELLDGFAGLWCVNIGYGQESVVAAATEQMRQLPYAKIGRAHV